MHAYLKVSFLDYYIFSHEIPAELGPGITKLLQAHWLGPPLARAHCTMPLQIPQLLNPVGLWHKVLDYVQSIEKKTGGKQEQ